MNRTAHLIQGGQAELKAHDYLLKRGLAPICRNYRCKHGELDLVMSDQHTLVFVEVRYRKSDSFGSAVESVTAAKQARIIAAAQHYLSKNKQDSQVRFDVVGISGTGKIDWIKNAF